MVVCECVLSENTLKHVKIVQNMLHNEADSRYGSDVFDMLLRYIISELDTIPVDDLILIDDYFTKHPSFLNEFYTDVMMSATFHSDYYSN